MAKIYGQLEVAQLENLASDPSSTASGYVYFNTVSLFCKYYNGSAWKVLVDTNSSQALTNKDYDGGTASNTSRLTVPKNTLTNLNALTRKQATILYDTVGDTFYGDNGTTLTAFAAAASDVAYVGTDPEPGGSTPFSLVSTDKKIQNIDPAGAITVLLPTTGILQGEMWGIENISANLVTVQASDASAIDAIETGYIYLRALVNTPVTNTDWEVVEYYSYGTSSINFVFNGTGGGGTGGIAVDSVRIGNNVTTKVAAGVAASTGTSSTALVAQSAIKSIYRPAASVAFPSGVVQGGTQYATPGLTVLDSAGILTLYADYSGSAAWSNSVNAGYSGNSAFVPFSYSK